MNLSTIALLIFAWQLISSKGSDKPKIDDFANFLSDDTKDILGAVSKLTSQTATSQDKTGAIFQMMTNPTVMNLAQNIFGKGGNEQPSDTSTTQTTTTVADEGLKNDEGYFFGQPSADSQEFFKPIENIADVEIKHKLYWFYDNWYLAK